MSFELEINIGTFLHLFSQENISSIIPNNISQETKTQKVCLNFDSREIKKGDIFWVLVGNSFNPHKGNFIKEAFEKGAIMAIVNAKEVELNKIPLAVTTEDTTKALLKFAKAYRKQFKNLKVVGITGSAGKTSTKEMLAAVLEQENNVLVTKGNLNNLFGVPMTLLGLKNEHEIAVIEMGTSQPGEIRTLSQTAIPNVAVITNVAAAHLEGLVDINGVFEEKKSIVEGFEKKGTLIINADDENLCKIRNSAKYNVITYGVNKGIVKPNSILWENGCANFRISRTWFKLNVPGIHNLYNALAAIAVGELFKIPKNTIAEALSKVESYDKRMQIIRKNEITIVSDCYNANPHSMEMSLKTLEQMKCNGRKIVVLGDMKELGQNSKEYHYKIGAMLPNLSVDYLIAIGSDAIEYCKGAENSGFKQTKIKYFEDNQNAAKVLINLVHKNDIILFKASRSMKLEEVQNILLKTDNNL